MPPRPALGRALASDRDECPLFPSSFRNPRVEMCTEKKKWRRKKKLIGLRRRNWRGAPDTDGGNVGGATKDDKARHSRRLFRVSQTNGDKSGVKRGPAERIRIRPLTAWHGLQESKTIQRDAA